MRVGIFRSFQLRFVCHFVSEKFKVWSKNTGSTHSKLPHNWLMTHFPSFREASADDTTPNPTEPNSGVIVQGSRWLKIICAVDSAPSFVDSTDQDYFPLSPVRKRSAAGAMPGRRRERKQKFIKCWFYFLCVLGMIMLLKRVKIRLWRSDKILALPHTEQEKGATKTSCWKLILRLRKGKISAANNLSYVLVMALKIFMVMSD